MVQLKNNLNFIKFINHYLKIFGNERKIFIFKPMLVSKPNGKNVLVISPHFDDEVIGCGGTLVKHLNAGDNVSVVYLTDGTNGIPDIKNKKLVTKIRKKESIEALKVIGVKKYYFLDEVEGAIIINIKTIKNLNKIMTHLKPDLVYLPWFMDNHVDHMKTNKVLFEVCKNYRFSFNICAYEVWTPLIPNIIIDIGKEFEIKKKALLCFKSQLKYNDYTKSILGLNQYRAIYNLNSKSYGEAFLFLSSMDYFKLFKSTNIYFD